MNILEIHYSIMKTSSSSIIHRLPSIFTDNTYAILYVLVVSLPGIIAAGIGLMTILLAHYCENVGLSNEKSLCFYKTLGMVSSVVQIYVCIIYPILQDQAFLRQSDDQKTAADCTLDQLYEIL
ncbi:hypothetical protein [Paenibacillus sp. An7]|uniref:hypothetical protein n=1 Tax=Paenibacillus sp. An7 TaxID=2689577 RepID=UPI0013589E9F|nr:hypothetical protein [Paenibacillus sp. An7]